MYARISTYELDSGHSDEAVVAFRGAIDRIRGLSGLLDAYFLVDDDGTRALTVTVWESAAAMEASRVAASSARTDAARAVGATVSSSCEYAVPIHVGVGES